MAHNTQNFKIELKKIDNVVVGYDIVAETKEESLVMGNVRNLHFFGFDDTYIIYNGMLSGEGEEERLVKKLSFIQEKFTHENN